MHPKDARDSSSLKAPKNIELESLLYNLLHLLLEIGNFSVTKMLCVFGCQLPHPLMYKIIVRVRTTNQSSPMQAYNQAINDLDKELDTLKNQFEAEMAKFSDH
ncbi:hypothetical protein YC2023_031225 [Brassica napus]